MSNDKPVATATIKFYSNKHIEVELDTLHGVNPRMLSIAGNLLNKKYREMRNKFNAKEHQKARQAAVEAEKQAVEDDAAFHKAEDARLLKAALADVPGPVEPEKTEPEPEGEKEAEDVSKLAAELLAAGESETTDAETQPE